MSRTHPLAARRRTHVAHLSNARTLAVFAMTTALSVAVSACGREVTEPTDVRPKANARPAALAVTGSAVWNGHTVAIESQQRNSAGQTVCLDIPWGIAFSGQDVNYYPCHYGPAQQFVLSAWDAGFGESWVVIKPVSSSSVCFDIRGGTTLGSEHLQLFTCKSLSSASANNQIFLLPAANSPSAVGTALVSTICVAAGYPNFVLDVPLPTTTTSYVQQYRLNRGQNQLWRFKDLTTGQYFISPTGSAWNNC